MAHEALKEVNICIRNILALTPKPGPSIDDVLNSIANELGVTQQTISDWIAGKGTIEPWQLEILKKRARMDWPPDG